MRTSFGHATRVKPVLVADETVQLDGSELRLSQWMRDGRVYRLTQGTSWNLAVVYVTNSLEDCVAWAKSKGASVSSRDHGKLC